MKVDLKRKKKELTTEEILFGKKDMY